MPIDASELASKQLDRAIIGCSRIFLLQSYKGEKMKEELLVPQEQYLKSGIHIGTKFKTKYMGRFIYKTRPDKLSVLNLTEIDKRLKIAANLLSNYKPEEILIVSRRENGWKGVRLMGELTGMRTLAGRYPPGILTNKNLETFIEVKVIVVSDPYIDRNAVKDALKIGIPVIALCDTNNQSNNLDLVVPCNNKGKKALGLAFYILTKEYLKSKGKELKETPEDFTEE